MITVPLQRLAVVLMLVFTLTSCRQSSGSAIQADVDGSTGSATEAEPTVTTTLTFLPEYLLDDMQNLQAAIDYRQQFEVASCARSQGWEVPLPSAAAIKASLDSLVGQTASSPIDLALVEIEGAKGPDIDADPFLQYLTGLDPEAQQDLEEDLTDCAQSSTANITHPLQQEGTWLHELIGEVDNRIDARPEFISSRTEAERCFSQSTGIAGFGMAYQQVGDAANQIIQEFEAAQISFDDAVRDLAELGDEYDGYEEQQTICFDAHFNLVSQLRADIMNELAGADANLAFNVKELADFVDSYSEELRLFEE